MIIGQNGPISEEQAAAECLKQAQEAAEQKRLRNLSKRGLAGDIRRTMRANSANHLCYAYGVALLSVLGDLFKGGDDPYRRKTKQARGKVGRQRAKSAAPAGAK